MRMRRLRISMVLLLAAGPGASSACARRPRARKRRSCRTSARTRSGSSQFEWQIYQTDHFEIFYYPAIEPHLTRIAGYAENAYSAHQRRAEARPPEPHADDPVQDAERVPDQQRVVGVPEGVLAFAEPEQRRMVLPIDEPPDQLYRLITHELTHVFEFDIIPVGPDGPRACRSGWTKAWPTTWPATGTSWT